MVGVSEVTASVVLNGSRSGTRVSDASRERILTAASQLGYRRNGSAHAITTGRFDSVGLLVSTSWGQSYLSYEIIEGIYNGIRSANLNLLVAYLFDNEPDAPEAIPKFLREWSVDGLLIDYIIQTPPYLMAQIQESGVPAVWLNSKRTTDCVYPDDHLGGRLAAEHLIALGHRRIVMAVPNVGHSLEDHYSVTDRCRGYSEAMEAAGLAPTIVRRDRGPRQWLALVEEWGRRDDRPSALIGYDASVSQPLLFGALTMGLRVPHDLSIVTFGIPVVDNVVGRVVTAVDLPEAEMGRAGIRMLMQRIAAPAQAAAPIVLPVSIATGETSGPPNRKA